MHEKRIARSLLLAALGVAIILAAGCGKDDKAKPDGQKGGHGEAWVKQPAQPRVSAETRDEQVATIGGESVTRGMLAEFAQHLKKPPQAPQEAFKGKPKELEPLIDELALALQVGKRADEVLEKDATAELHSKETVELIKTLYEQDILTKLVPPTPEEIRAYYEENEEAFKAPVAFSVRHIFVSNYQEVVTKPGQTLESLARDVSGDVSAVDLILVDNGPKSPRAPGYAKGNRATIKPLEPGERLLVPVSEETRKKNLEKIRQAKERVEKGEEFEKVAREVSDGSNPGKLIPWLGTNGRAILPEIREAVRKTDQGAVTDVFETRHGYNIMKVEMKAEQPPVPFDEAAQQIAKVLRDKKLNEMMDAYATRLYESPMLEVDYDKFADPATPDGAVVVKVGATEYTNKQVQMPMAGAVRKDMPHSQIMRLLRVNARIQNDLFALEARKKGLNKTVRYRMRVAGAVYMSYLETYLEQLRRKAIREDISPEEAKAYFESNRSAFAMPPKVTYFELAARIPTGSDGKPAPDGVNEATARLAGWVRNVQNRQELQQAIAEHSEDKASKARGGLVREKPVGALSPEASKTLGKMKPGALSEPYVEDGYVKIAWYESLTPRRALTLEDVGGNLPDLVKAHIVRGYPETFRRAMLERAKVKIGG